MSLRWKPEVIDWRGADYGYVMDRAESRRAIFAVGYPNSGLNVTAGNWGPLTESELNEARGFLIENPDILDAIRSGDSGIVDNDAHH